MFDLVRPRPDLVTDELTKTNRLRPIVPLSKRGRGRGQMVSVKP